MRAFLCLMMVSVLLYSCTETSKSDVQMSSVDTLPEIPGSLGDSLTIGSKGIIIAGDPNRDLQNCYFAVRGKDTSDFKCYLSRWTNNKTIEMKLRFSPTMSYRQQMDELALILIVVKSYFQLDSLRSISIGRLISTGDLAVELTNQYLQQNKKIPSVPLVNREIDAFLLTSKLTEDFNSVLKAYSVSVSKISTEKDFFWNTEDLYTRSKIETDSAKVPSRVLDAQVWMRIQPTVR